MILIPTHLTQIGFYMTEHSAEYTHLVTLAGDLESLGVKTVTPQTLRVIAEHIEADMILREVSFEDFENLGDIEF